LNNLQAENNGQIIWSWLESSEDLNSLKNGELDIQEIIEEIYTNMPETKIILIAGPNENKKEIFVFGHAAKGVSAIEILKPYNPRGNVKNANAILPLDKEEWLQKFIQPLKVKLDKKKI